MAAKRNAETRAGVPMTNLDDALFDGAEATKRDLIDYLEGVAERFLPELDDRPLSVIRVHRGQEAFMQKNVPKYTPDWVATVDMWAEASRREVSYALCNDLRTLLWFGNQRAVEYHTTLFRAAAPEYPTHLVLDLDPPPSAAEPLAAFRAAAAAAQLVRTALTEMGLDGAVKTSGAKGVHVVVPVAPGVTHEAAAAATRAIAARVERLDPDTTTTAFLKDERGGKVFVDATRAGGATVVTVYSPRGRPGTPVSFPIGWDDLDSAAPGDFTIHTALGLLGSADRWAAMLPDPQNLPEELVTEGEAIPTPRVQAMHEGKRRKRAQRTP